MVDVRFGQRVVLVVDRLGDGPRFFLGTVALVDPNLPFWSAFVDDGRRIVRASAEGPDGRLAAVHTDVGVHERWLGRAP